MPQWSLRTLLIATAIVPLAIYAISKATSFYISAVITIATTAWIGVAIVASTGIGSRGAWARGATVAATAYGLLIVCMGTELELRGSKLPTSGVLFYAHDAWAQPTNELVRVPEGGTVLLGGIKRLNEFTPTDVEDEDANVEPEEENLGLRVGQTPSNDPVPTSTGPGTIAGLLPYFPPTRVPYATSFAKIGHIYWGVLIGIAGGCFAQWLGRREQPCPALRTTNGIAR
jgi:small neutral amino acid transporter SnatA (MarC family)